MHKRGKVTYWKVQIVWYRKKFISVRNQCCRSIVVVRVTIIASATAVEEEPVSLSWLVIEEALIARRPRSRRHSLKVCHETVYLKENEIWVVFKRGQYAIVFRG